MLVTAADRLGKKPFFARKSTMASLLARSQFGEHAPEPGGVGRVASAVGWTTAGSWSGAVMTPSLARISRLPAVAAAASSDPGDTKFLQYAEGAKADYIVTGNKRHFRLNPMGQLGL